MKGGIKERGTQSKAPVFKIKLDRKFETQRTFIR